MQPTFTVPPAFPNPSFDESDAFTGLIGEPEFQHGHDWVTNPIVEELAACMKHDVQYERVTI